MKLSMRLFSRYRNGKFLSFYVEFDDGRRKSLKTKDKTRAKRLYRQIEREYFKSRVAYLTGKCIKRLGDYRDEFIQWAEPVQSRSTFRANRLALNKLIEHASQDIYLDRITIKHIDIMIAEEKKKGNTVNSINNYIRHARAALNKAVDWQYVKKNPLAGVKELPLRKKQPKFLRKRDFAKIIATIKDIDLRRMIVAYIATGRRRSELVFLEWRDIDLVNNRYTIRKSKSHLERSYHINSLFRAVLDSIGKKEGRVFARWKHPDTITHQVKRALIAAEYSSYHLHTIRHSFASFKAAEGRSLKEIQELLGHEDIKATQIYTHLTDTHLADISEINIGPVDLFGEGKK